MRRGCVRRLGWVAVWGWLLTAVGAGAAGVSTGETVVARGKGVEVKRSRLDESVIAFKAQSATEGQAVPKEKMAEVEAMLLDRIVIVQLLNNRATEAERAAARDRGETLFGQLRSRAPTPAVFEAQLKTAGLTVEQLKARIVEQATSEAVVEREVASKVELGASAVQDFYEANPKYFERPEQVRASHVLLGTLDPVTQQELPEAQRLEKRAVAEKVLARARKGDDFAALAKEFSEDPGSKDKGGEYTFPRGQMVKEFEETAFGLKEGEVSGLVTTRFGYHIIKLSERLPAGVMPLAAVEGDIKRHLVQEELKKRLPEYYDEIKKEAGLEILDPALVPPRREKS